LVQEKVAGGAQGGDVADLPATIGVGRPCGAAERAAHVLLAGAGSDAEQLACGPHRRH
jgi:hypothetical protein